jgi:hypothetical protein
MAENDPSRGSAAGGAGLWGLYGAYGREGRGLLPLRLLQLLWAGRSAPVSPELAGMTWSASNGSFSFFPSPQRWQRKAESRTALARRRYSPPYCPVSALRMARLASCICLACSACGGQSGSGESDPHIRQGFGNRLIFSPTCSLEVDGRRVVASSHGLGAVGADGLVLFAFKAANDCYCQRTSRALVEVSRHGCFFLHQTILDSSWLAPR